jgi:hypothetical protein
MASRPSRKSASRARSGKTASSQAAPRKAAARKPAPRPKAAPIAPPSGAELMPTTAAPGITQGVPIINE